MSSTFCSLLSFFFFFFEREQVIHWNKKKAYNRKDKQGSRPQRTKPAGAGTANLNNKTQHIYQPTMQLNKKTILLKHLIQEYNTNNQRRAQGPKNTKVQTTSALWPFAASISIFSTTIYITIISVVFVLLSLLYGTSAWYY